ncbi:hypothetical protein HanXRQr2_Chr03g0094111 [Helianthus annuus]|uniref:Secreted protein n=1 Tax=Helianthus annuus TaxID=4232 RepID=A0A9K3JEQ8_HELAN|nr:hypothetical protein HanXRQr2_Chr03g0094111 [Helianthus annuus]KAJ0942322.1 hypothetical protein HanPSC8_Chr03g0090611 [Helianthus annuus]
MWHSVPIRISLCSLTLIHRLMTMSQTTCCGSDVLVDTTTPVLFLFLVLAFDRASCDMNVTLCQSF